MTLATAPSFLLEIVHGLREAIFMFWETLWALVLGFVISGAVQAFVSKDRMRRRLGDHRPASIARASAYGMVSSSCSYAASSMARSLVKKGADFTSAMVFMFASTNLVIELGLVLAVLLGWQFMAAEFVGGPIMIALLALVGGAVFTAKIVSAARRRALGNSNSLNRHDPHTQASPNGAEDEVEDEVHVSDARTVAGWSDAANFSVADATMLRKELLIGYTVAGLLAVLVPQSLWNALFISGHGFWSSLENALVGPLIAIVSWVCSIGNVPMAAALWSGGISFGGVIAFIFADLIAMPLLIIYRKFYGTRVMWRMLVTFYVVMALAGLITEGIFAGLHLIPARRTIAPGTAHFSWNYTTFLNLAFIGVAIGVWSMARNRSRFGGGTGYAIDPVCSMQVRTSDAPVVAESGGASYFFCSERCRDRFMVDPARRVGDFKAAYAVDTSATAVDPVCGMLVEPATAAAFDDFEGVKYWFCTPGCAARFADEPTRFTGPSASAESMGPKSVDIGLSRQPQLEAVLDPVCGKSVSPTEESIYRNADGVDHWFCSVTCADRFQSSSQSPRQDVDDDIATT